VKLTTSQAGTSGVDSERLHAPVAHRYDSEMNEPDPMGRRRHWWWLVGIALLIAVAPCGWIVGQRVRSPSQAASRAAPPTPSWITATVERRVLSQTVISRGEVRPQISVPVRVPSSIEGSPVVTAIAVNAGTEVTEGTRVLEVSGRPVFVLKGDVPVYRSLKPKMTGADVRQLQAALTRLGCDTTPDAGIFGPATKTCVAKLYADAGYAPVPTSPTDGVDVVAAQQTVTDAQAAADSARLAFDDAIKGPSDGDYLAADTALASAQRSYNDAVASRDESITQAQRGLTRAQTTLDQVRNSPDATASDVAAAEGDVDTALAAVGDAQRSGDSAVASANDAMVLERAARQVLDEPPDVTAEYMALGQALGARDKAQARLDELQASVGPTVAQGEIVFAPNLPARVQQIVTTLGPVGADRASDQPGVTAASNDLATLAAGDLVVGATLRSSDRELVRVGMAVELLDEQTNTAYPATISSIADTQSTDADAQPGFVTVITPTEPLPDSLSGANLRVTITAASTEIATLVAPLAAVSSAADGSTNVSIIPEGSSPSAAPTVVPIKAGLSADGFVSIEPVRARALNEGDKVVVGR
jgi:hypothetical protein